MSNYVEMGTHDQVRTHVDVGSEDRIGESKIDLYFCSSLNAYNLNLNLVLCIIIFRV
jgi:hypothetical protein